MKRTYYWTNVIFALLALIAWWILDCISLFAAIQSSMPDNILICCGLTIVFIILVCFAWCELFLYIDQDSKTVLVTHLFRAPVVLHKDQIIYYNTIRTKYGCIFVLSNDLSSLLDRKYSHTVFWDSKIYDQYLKGYRCIPTAEADWDLLAQNACRKAVRGSICIAPWYRRQFIGEVCLLALFLLLYLIIKIGNIGNLDYLIIGGGLILPFPIIGMVRQLRKPHYLTTVSVSETAISSKLFRKNVCSVDLTQPVYYAVFRGREYRTSNHPYVVISNSWFNYYRVNKEDQSYLSVYGTSSQVAFPYNADTAPYCDFDHWICVGGRIS